MSERFRDRAAAGALLATHLAHYAARPDVVVLGLPRGGVPVAFAVASALRVPLDVIVVRKLGVPGHGELAMGAIAGGDVVVRNEDVLRDLAIAEATLQQVVAEERQELQRREHLYRGDRALPPLAGRTAILIDDGLATGATMRAAVVAVNRRHVARRVVATPVAVPVVCAEFQASVEEVVCLRTPEPLYAVGYWYDDFAQTTDDEVRDLLARAI